MEINLPSPRAKPRERESQRGSGTRLCPGHAGKAGALRGSNEAGKGGTAIGLDRTSLARQLPSGSGQQPRPQPPPPPSLASLSAEVSVPAGGDQARPSPPAAALISLPPHLRRRRLSALRVTGSGPSSPAETMGSREAGSALRLDGEEDSWAF